MAADVSLNIDISKKGSGDEEAALGLEALAKAADNAKDQLSELDLKLAETRVAMIAAGKTFNETGDISPLKSLLKDERQLSSVSKSITRGAEAITAELTNAGEQAGQGFIAKFGSFVSNGLNSLSGTAPTGLTQWLIAGGVAAAPEILAAIDGAVLAGVGSVGIGAAIIGQIKDPAVSGAFKSLGSEIMADLTAASESFRYPLVRASIDFHDAWQSILPGLQASFEALAPAFYRLADGMAGLVTHLMPGFNEAMQASVPVLETIADQLPRLGDAMSSFFSSVAKGGEGGREAMQLLLVVIDTTIVTLGKLIEWGSKAFEWANKFLLTGPLVVLALDKTSGSVDKNKKSLEELNAEGFRTANALDVVTGAVTANQTAQEKLNATMQTGVGRGSALKQQLDLLYGTQIAAADASQSFDSAMVTLRDTVHSNTTSTGLSKVAIDGHTAAIARAEASIKTNQAAINANKGSVDTHKAAILSSKAAIEANQAALGKHTTTADANALSLGTNTKTGLANRAMLEQVAKASVDMTVADVNNGVAVADATKKHQDRIEKLRQEAINLGFTKTDTDKLIATYGEVPKNVGTNVALTGANAVYKQLLDLKIAQLALSQNLDVSAATREVHNQMGTGIGGLAAGGRIPGPPSTTDNMVASGPWGMLGLATGEFVVNALDTQKALPLLQWINSGMPGYAAGGLLGSWPSHWTFPVDASHTKIPTTLAALKQKYALPALGGSAASGALGAWIAQAMALTGVPASWAGPLHTLIMRESGGNPNAINLTDSNAQAGHPSQGLAQTIPSTFAAYHMPGTSWNITDPVANIAAAIRYILSRYGGIQNVQQANANLPPKGYAAGGLIPTMAMDSGYGVLARGANLVLNGTGKREPIYGGVAAGHPGRPAPVALSLSLDASPGSLEYTILNMIRAHVTNSGGNVQAALGRRGH